MSSSNPQPVKLVESLTINHEVRHLVFEAQEAPEFDFVAGQHISLGAVVDGERVERHYSIASAPDGSKHFELCVKVGHDDSVFGRHLATLPPGAQLECSGPAGTFRLKEPVRDSVFVASGTGVAPLRAMLMSLVGGEEDRSGGADLTMIFGTREPDWGLYCAEFQALAELLTNVHFWLTVSRPPEGWKGRRGRVQQHVREALRERSRPVDVYLCGHSAMVKEVRQSLTEAGLDEDSIIYEKYG